MAEKAAGTGRENFMKKTVDKGEGEDLISHSTPKRGGHPRQRKKDVDKGGTGW